MEENDIMRCKQRQGNKQIRKKDRQRKNEKWRKKDKFINQLEINKKRKEKKEKETRPIGMTDI